MTQQFSSAPERRPLADAAAGTPMPGLLLAFCLAAAVLALRAPDALTLPQFWAEDGLVFFVSQYGQAWPALLEPCAGYLHLLTRLVAWFATLFSNVHAPLIYNLAAIGLGAAAVASLRKLPVPASAFWIFLAALALTPTNVEVFGTLTNVQWLLQVYLLLPLARCVGGVAAPRPLVACVLAAAVGLSGPFCIFAVAGALAGLAYRSIETRAVPQLSALLRAHPEMLVLLVCSIIQASLVALWPDTQYVRAKLLPEWPAIRDMLAALQTHTFGAALMPHAVFFLLTVGAVIGSWLGAGSAQGRAFVVAVACFVGVQLWTVAGKHATVPGPLLDLSYADRYFLLFKMTFWVWLLLGLRWLYGRLGHLALPVVVSTLALIAVINNERLRRAPLTDLNWRDHALRMDRGEAVTAPINPEPWTITVPARTP